jgi:hypothetical protein
MKRLGHAPILKKRTPTVFAHYCLPTTSCPRGWHGYFYQLARKVHADVLHTIARKIYTHLRALIMLPSYDLSQFYQTLSNSIVTATCVFYLDLTDNDCAPKQPYAPSKRHHEQY